MGVPVGISPAVPSSGLRTAPPPIPAPRSRSARWSRTPGRAPQPPRQGPSQRPLAAPMAAARPAPGLEARSPRSLPEGHWGPEGAPLVAPLPAGRPSLPPPRTCFIRLASWLFISASGSLQTALSLHGHLMPQMPGGPPLARGPRKPLTEAWLPLVLGKEEGCRQLRSSQPPVPPWLHWLALPPPPWTGHHLGLLCCLHPHPRGSYSRMVVTGTLLSNADSRFHAGPSEWASWG